MLWVVGMIVFPFRVRLPYFDHGIGDRSVITIQHEAYEEHMLTLRGRLCDAAYTAFITR
jgi:hypothetical protein